VSGSDVAATVLLWAGVTAELVCVAGVLWFRDAFDGLHFVAAATTIGPALIAAAAVVTGFPSVAGTIGCVTACVLLFGLNPVLTSATGRAGRNLDAGSAGGDEPA
jgi:multisubunit Na+/H+ antiporter MnhG subunit